MAKWNIGAFLRTLTKGAEMKNFPPVEQAEEDRSALAQERCPAAEDAAARSELKGALLEVWRQWAGRNLPPVLSLTTGKQMEDLHMDAQTLEKERVRLMVMLEKDAQKRLAVIEKAEKNKGGSIDAVCRVYLSRDKMAAWSFVFPPVGEGELHGETIGKALEESGVTTGIDPASMVCIFQEPQYFKLVPIAIGTPPVEGVSGSVTERYPREIAHEVKLDENGVADYRALNYVQVVEKDAVICDITLPQPGEAGVRVDGKVVEPKPVRAARVPAGKNTAVTEDGLRLIATRDGHLTFVNETFQVSPLLEIQGDVDYSTGNIDFSGDGHICGDVRENFTVYAEGTVTVDGLVEAATVEAGGDLVIARGVVGDGRALLKSNGCVRVRYLENCAVYAKGDIYADCIIASRIFSDSSIDVTSGRGSIIGGALTAAVSIKAHTIGAQSGRKTELTLGILPYVQNELRDIKEDLYTINSEKSRLDQELAYLEQKQGMEGISEKVAKARMRWSVLRIKEQQLVKRRERLQPMAPDISRCRIEGEIIYPVTSLEVQTAIWTATTVRRNCKVVYDAKMDELRELH